MKFCTINPKKLCDHFTYCQNYKCYHATSHSVTEICNHPNRALLVLHSVATCETTVEVCLNCGKHLSKPKTDCI